LSLIIRSEIRGKGYAFGLVNLFRYWCNEPIPATLESTLKP